VINNGQIRVHILEVHGDRIRVGIDAPREISIDREEVFAAKIREANKGNGSAASQ
jgi:carbon storage regulator CsrA